MRKFYRSSAVRQADRLAAERLGIPGEVLMENAGRAAAEIIAERCGGNKKVLLLCGPGNNGGDGFAAARHLSLMGFDVAVVSTRDADEYTNEAAYAARSAEQSGIRILRSDRLSDGDIVSLLRDSPVAADAILGTGSKGAPRGEAARLIELSSCHGSVVSLDIPSGVDSDTGEICGVSVNASVTVTFLAEKPGLAIAPGMFRCGHIRLAGIGARPDAVLKEPPALVGCEPSDIAAMLPELYPGVHKGSRGSLLIVGGSSMYRGAPVLAAMGALRAGCGSAVLAVPESVVPSAASLLPEAVFVPLPENGGHISSDGLASALLPHLERCSSVVVGPGLGRSPDAEYASRLVYDTARVPVVIDADALRSDYGHKRGGVVITPHAGEAAHILGISPGEAEARRLDACEALAEKFETVLLKGPHTIVSSGG
ncbi:MAG: NAD(P)H-hydrate epimerase, partial [Synergistaceae bacterium]|nr:NAD(P)H-hydrate epimerase [Synergistaceae bacterium]